MSSHRAPAECCDEVALTDEEHDLFVYQRPVFGDGQFLEGFQAVSGVPIVPDVLVAGDVGADIAGVAPVHQHVLDERAHQCLVGAGCIEVGDFSRPVDGRVPRWGLRGVFRDHIPVLDNPIVVVGIEEVEGHPFRLAVVERLVGVYEQALPVLQRPNDLDVADRVASDEWFEELDEPLNPVAYPGRVLGVSVSCVLGDGLSNVAVANTLGVEANRVLDLPTHSTSPPEMAVARPWADPIGWTGNACKDPFNPESREPSPRQRHRRRVVPGHATDRLTGST